MVRGVHGGGGHMHNRGHVWQWAYMEGACVAGGVHGRGLAWQWSYMVGRHAWQAEACVEGETATAAGGTHPTGMHSYLRNYFSLSKRVFKETYKVAMDSNNYSVVVYREYTFC